MVQVRNSLAPWVLAHLARQLSAKPPAPGQLWRGQQRVDVFRIYRWAASQKRFCGRLSKKRKRMENRKIKHEIGGRDFSEAQGS